MVASGLLAIPGFLSRSSGDNARTAATGSSDLPFKIRLKAWWDGCDARDLVPAARIPAIPPMPQGVGPDAAAGDEPREPLPPPATPWPIERIALVERLWGEGLHTPGGVEHLLELAKPFAINQTNMLLDFGCGLGGASRAIAQNFGTWCTGIDWCATLAMAGVERSTRVGLEKKAAIRYQPAERMALKAAAYSAVFSKEALFTIESKQIAIQGFADTLRPAGQLCFTDYVLGAPDAGDSKDARTWRAIEPLGAHPWTVDEYRDCLAGHGFDLRVAEDMTDRHVTLIHEGWKRLAAEMQPGSITPKLLPLLVREAQIWASREAMLRRGKLKLYRFFALKSGA